MSLDRYLLQIAKLALICKTPQNGDAAQGEGILALKHPIQLNEVEST